MMHDNGAALYIKLDDLPPGMTAARFLALVRPADETGWPAAIEAWRQVFAHWNRKKNCHD
jgi:hypothetical protein